VPEPLLSVGIPTYNRAAKLERAVESVLAQTHLNLELVISDNASTDGTRSVCLALAERDPRIRYLRSPVNRGPTANFNVLFSEMRGEYVMVLSDDDWLDPDYLSACLAELTRRPELVLACGWARYLRENQVVKRGVRIQLTQTSPSERVLEYLRNVDENGVFYGLMARATLRRAAPLRNVLGNDWLLAAAIAAQGRLATIESSGINRELDGTSGDFPRLVRTLGLPSWQAWVPHLAMAWEVLRDVGWRAPVYRELSPARRARLALAGAWAVISWRSLAWHLTMPLFAAAGRRSGGGWLWRAYQRFTRRLGAGRAAG
jgi:glycosyltransferase involved in cell wall biosynthesis